MGRHSAPDDADDEVGTQPTLALAPDPELAAVIAARGRHARGDSGEAATEVELGQTAPDAAPARSPDLDQTQRISIISDAPPAPDPPFALDLHTITEPAPSEPEPESGPLTLDEIASPEAPEQPAPEATAKQEEKADKRAAKAERKAAKKDAAKKDVRESDTRADLRLLRHNPAVRAQAIGAVIASFLVYTLVMIVLGRATDYLMWLWLPIVASGVLVGLVLDLAHRRAAKQAGEEPPAGQPAR